MPECYIKYKFCKKCQNRSEYAQPFNGHYMVVEKCNLIDSYSNGNYIFPNVDKKGKDLPHDCPYYAEVWLACQKEMNKKENPKCHSPKF